MGKSRIQQPVMNMLPVRAKGRAALHQPYNYDPQGIKNWNDQYREYKSQWYINLQSHDCGRFHVQKTDNHNGLEKSQQKGTRIPHINLFPLSEHIKP